MLHCQRAKKKKGQHTGFSSIFQNNRKKNSTPGLADFGGCQATKRNHKLHSAKIKIVVHGTTNSNSMVILSFQAYDDYLNIDVILCIINIFPQLHNFKLTVKT